MRTFRLTNPTTLLLAAAAALLSAFAPAPFSLGSTALAQELPTDDPPVNFRITGYSHKSVVVAWEVPRDRGITNYVLQRYESDGSESPWDLNRIEDSTNGGAGHGQQFRTEPDTQYQFVLTLMDDSGTTIIEASVSVRTLSAPTTDDTSTDDTSTDDTSTDDTSTDDTSTPDPSVSTDARLSSLSLSGIDLRLGDRLRPFSPEWTDYDASVAEDVTETTVSATVNHSGASYVIKLGGVIDDDGVIPLRQGNSVITIAVTAEDGITTRIYTVRVTRGELPAPPPQSTLATLSALTLSGIDFGTFDDAITSYTASVANNVTETTVTPTVKHSGASYVIKLNGVIDDDSVIPLTVGSNVITIEVTAEDGSTSRTYTVIVTRAAPTQEPPPTRTDEEPPPPVTGDLPTDDPPVNFRITGYDHKSVVVAWEVPRDRGITNYVLQRYESDGSESPWDLNRIEDSTNGGAGHGQQFRTEPDTQYRFVLTLMDDSGTTIIEKSLSVRTLPAPDPDPPTPDPDPPAPDPDPPTPDPDPPTPDPDPPTPDPDPPTPDPDPPKPDPDPPKPDPSVSTDATLSSLSLSGIDLRRGDRLHPFSPDWTGYDASVAEDVTETTVSATVNHSGASYVIKLGGVIDDDSVIPLRQGSSVITIAVTAEDGITTRIYTVRVTRGELPAPPPQSTLATLSALTLSGIDFGTFDDATTSYSASVANNVTETTVTPTVKHSGASYVIKLNGVIDDDGVIPLAVGSNVITIEVTAEDGSTSRTYTVIVTRAAPTQEPPPTRTDEETPPPGTGDLPTDDPPVNFRITGYDHKSVVVAWEVPRDRGITNYVLQRYESDGSESPWDLNRIEDSTNGGAGHGQQFRTEPDTQYRFVLTLMDDSGTTIIEKSLSVRTLPAPDPSDPTAETTTLDPSETTDGTSTPDSSDPTDATLSSLSLSGIDLRLGDRLYPFSPGWYHYDARVAEDVTETTVTATVNNPDASYVIKLGGVIDDDGVIPLRMGSSVITIAVTAEDGITTRIYTVRVTRSELPEPPPQSTLATLSALTLSGIDFGTFDPATTRYSTQVPNDVAQATVTLTLNHSRASYVIKLNGVVDDDGVIPLAVGSNVITIEVTAENGSTSQTYTITVTRVSTDATLSGLSLRVVATLSGLTLSDIDFGTFDDATTSYTASVANNVTKITVTPTVNHSRASYVIKLGGVIDDGVIPLAVGSNVITIEVTAEDGSTSRTYTITVTRASAQAKLLAQETTSLPDEPQLYQNAPNPFNSQTVIPYFLLQPGLARLEVFALTGQRVTVLIQGQQQAGHHRLHWNGRDDADRPLASGIYLYRLVTAEGVLTRKLILLR